MNYFERRKIIKRLRSKAEEAEGQLAEGRESVEGEPRSSLKGVQVYFPRNTRPDKKEKFVREFGDATGRLTQSATSSSLTGRFYMGTCINESQNVAISDDGRRDPNFLAKTQITGRLFSRMNTERDDCILLFCFTQGLEDLERRAVMTRIRVLAVEHDVHLSGLEEINEPADVEGERLTLKPGTGGEEGSRASFKPPEQDESQRKLASRVIASTKEIRTSFPRWYAQTRRSPEIIRTKPLQAASGGIALGLKALHDRPQGGSTIAAQIIAIDRHDLGENEKEVLEVETLIATGAKILQQFGSPILDWVDVRELIELHLLPPIEPDTEVGRLETMIKNAILAIAARDFEEAGDQINFQRAIVKLGGIPNLKRILGDSY